MTTDEALTPRDWKHRWLTCNEPWECLAIWMEAKWTPLDPDERWEFAIEVGGWPNWIENPYERDEYGELVHDILLATHAYASDPDVPTDMLEPRPSWDLWPDENKPF